MVLWKQLGPRSGTTKFIQDLPSGHMMSKWHHTDIDATSFGCIDVHMTSLRRHVSAGYTISTLPALNMSKCLCCLGECSMKLLINRAKPGLEVIKLFSCSTQLSMTFFLLTNVKMPTTDVGILTFMSEKKKIAV